MHMVTKLQVQLKIMEIKRIENLNSMKQLRFLIARIDRIGDVVLSTPLPREIKKSTLIVLSQF